MRYKKYQRNQIVTLTDDMILIGTGVLIGVIGFWIWQKSQEDSAGSTTQPTQPIPTGVDSAGNPTYAQEVGPGGVAVFSNQQPAPLPAIGPSS